MGMAPGDILYNAGILKSSLTCPGSKTVDKMAFLLHHGIEVSRQAPVERCGSFDHWSPFLVASIAVVPLPSPSRSRAEPRVPRRCRCGTRTCSRIRCIR